MALTRFLYDPFTEFDRLFDDAFTSRFRPSTALTESSLTDESRLTKFRPKMDLIETKDNQIMARFELPGMKSGQVDVDVHNDRLTISGESQQSTETKDGQFVVREGSYGHFARTLQLPEGTQPEQVKARMENGVLEVTFPKAPPEQATKHIDIVEQI